MTKWESVKDSDKFGIAIYNYRQDVSFRLQLTLGEAVLMLQQNDGWYFGYALKNTAVRGFFPKSYIHICECEPDKIGSGLGLVLRHPPVVQELTAVLREWGTNWKRLYIKNSKLFKPVENLMNELISCRKKILSGTLPVDELRQMKKQVTSKIDVGNELLGLDMVVRDKEGNIVNHETTSTIELFRQHEVASEGIRAAMSGSQEKPSRPVTQFSHTLFVSVRTIICRLEQDVEFLMALYDAREGRTFTENFVIRWSKEELAKNQDQNLNMRVLFTDLGSKDLRREKVFLVCYVVRLGSMELCDPDQKNRRSSSSCNPSINLRRPYGVGALDVTMYTSGRLQSDDETLHSISLLLCGERDDLEGTLKKILTLKDVSAREHKGQGLRVSMRLLRGDMKQVREENPHLMLGTVALARKMGFPEVILPGDVRNDLYLTLLSGEFSKGSKSSDKNVQVTVRVCSEDGQVIEGVVSMGGGVPLQSEYQSVVYYHEDKPRWCEAFRIAVGIEKIAEFKVSHLLFTFKHRSSNDAKDKAEKAFALSYVRLIQDNGTTLQDTQHELLVYKVDHKKYVESDLAYLQLPSTRAELPEGQKPSKPGLSLSMKDNFLINTSVCSTKLTQNVDLLALLNWRSRPEHLKESLDALMKVGGEEVVKFIPDILDALFSILMQNSNSDLYDNMVFECLLHVIVLVSDLKYQHFQPILDLYIKENFCATLAYNKLIVVLKYHINNATVPGSQNHDLLYKTMKSIEYCIRFVVRSRQLFAQMNENKGQQQFELSLQLLFASICNLMQDDSGETLRIQGACLRYLPSAIPDILVVYDRCKLSETLMNIISRLAPGRLTMQKMMTIKDIVHSELFQYPECRKILLPCINARVKRLLETQEEGRSGYLFIHKIKSVAKIAKILGASKRNLHEHHAHSDEMDLCVSVLGDIMAHLFNTKSVDDIKEMMLSVLRTIIQTTIALDRESSLVGNLVAVMLSIFRQMDEIHFNIYLSCGDRQVGPFPAHFPTTTDLLDFLMEILLVFKDLVARPVFPSQWCEMIMLQNSIMLRALRFFSHTIRDRFFQPFEHQAWNNFFHCAIAFMTQPALQLDRFSVRKRFQLTFRYRDMRSEMGAEILSMWFNLGQAKIQFVPGLVGSFLKMTLIPETDLRKRTIPVFFDMMQCEFYSSRHPGESYADTKRDSSHIKANFSQFEDEIIAKLDTLIEEGWGDEHYKDLFYTIMKDLCQKHATMRDLGMRFVETAKKLIERLLEYRSVINDENKENRMICTVNLLNFYSGIKREQMYIRYVNKLCDLHLECDNFTEAAFTLQLHSQLLEWSDDPLPPLLLSTRFPHASTHRQLKEALYKLTIDYFDKGKMWETALRECKELERQYEEEVLDYTQLSDLLRKMSQFYDNIMKQVRPKPGYYRVGYYGKGFPSFLQNKMFIYRGKEYERLSDFSTRTMNQLPNAELMKTLSPPGRDITESLGQYVQINKVDPVMTEETLKPFSRTTNEQILQYHRVNNVQKFRFSRPFQKKDPAYTSEDADTNEFASLWLERTVLVTSYPLPGILQWFPVRSSQTFDISPLQNAIETMESSNKTLQELIIAHSSDMNLSLKPLTLRLSGILDAAVMGGITNYEKAFFSSEYVTAHPEDAQQLERLRNLIAEQVPLLGLGISLHCSRAPPLLSQLHSHLEKCYSEMKTHIEERYGKRTCDLKLNHMRNGRRKSRTAFGLYDQENASNRSSDVSLTPSESNNWSRVSSLTRYQVSTLKNLAGFSFSSSTSGGATLSRSWRGNSSSQLECSSSGSGRSMSNKFSRSTSLMTDAPDSPSKSKDSERENRKSEEKRNRLARKPVSLRHGNRKNSVDCKGDSSVNTSGSSLWYTDTDVLELTNSPARLPPQVQVQNQSQPSHSTPTAPASATAGVTTPVFELRQELTPLRPLRSDVEREKRMSRPSSGQFPSGPTTPVGGNSGSGTSSNRDSVETASEDDGIRPPLPLKSRETDTSLDGGSDTEADYSNLPSDLEVMENHIRNSPSTPSLRGKVVPPTPVEEPGSLPSVTLPSVAPPLPPALPVTPSSVRSLELD